MLNPLSIERISPPTVEEFYNKYVLCGKPVIITNMVNDWPALKLWNWEYFGKNFGEEKVGAMHLRNGEYDVYENRGTPVENIRVGDIMDSVAAGHLNGLALASLVDNFPEKLKDDYTVPKYCSKGKFPLSRLFLGPSGTITPLHQDYPENIYVLIKGKKRITLFKPQSPVYAMRFSKMPTHSPVDIERPDYDKYPRLKELQPFVVDLEAGETLYLPSLWWHHVRNLQPSIAMHFWWTRGWLIPVAWLASMYNKLKKQKK